MSVTKNVADYVEKVGINLSALSRKTDIPYSLLFDSLSEKGRHRQLKADELMKICLVLGKNPMDFTEDEP